VAPEGFGQDAQERLEVVVRAEQAHPPDRTVEDVVGQPGGGDSRGPRHEGRIPEATTPRQN
jgi:hypothetical protein